VEAGGEAADLASFGQDAMAGDEDWNGIGAARIADGAGAVGYAQGSREVLIRTGFANGDLQHDGPDLFLEIGGAGPIEWRELADRFAGKGGEESFARESVPEADGFGDGSRGRSPSRLCPVWKIEGSEAARGVGGTESAVGGWDGEFHSSRVASASLRRRLQMHIIV
jgi:hypothetical protein